jgi:N-acetylglutamate synthase-like GNAT family acetyltransferase
LRLIDVDRATEPTFLRCLHDERPDDPRVVRLRRRWFDAHRALGLRARVLILDTGEVAGLCQYSPIEHTHFVGEDLLVILCIWVHGYEHHIGNRQGNGYGRYILESIEVDARESGAGGLVAWGMDFPYWNPVSFYEHMGYVRVDKSGMAVLVWKPFRESASPPRFLRQMRRPPGGTEKVSVTAFVNGWCMGACSQCVTARDAVHGIEEIVDYREVDTSDPEVMRLWGISDGLFVDGEPYRPYDAPPTSEELRQDLLRLADEKRGSS